MAPLGLNVLKKHLVALKIPMVLISKRRYLLNLTWSIMVVRVPRVILHISHLIARMMPLMLGSGKMGKEEKKKDL